MDIFSQVQEIISKNLNISKDKITLESSLKDDLGADSLDAVEIVMDLEDTFNISIADDEAALIKTVSDLVEYIKSKS